MWSSREQDDHNSSHRLMLNQFPVKRVETLVAHPLAMTFPLTSRTSYVAVEVELSPVSSSVMFALTIPLPTNTPAASNRMNRRAKEYSLHPCSRFQIPLPGLRNILGPIVSNSVPPCANVT